MRNKAEIVDRWLERLVRGRTLPQTADPFRNPVGHRFREAIRTLVDELLGDVPGEMNPERVGGALASIVEIRAVEAATPRQALGFIFELKEILGADADGARGSRIDEMMLTAFDLYMQCRERIGQARIHETRRRVEMLERVMARGER